jgi:hypothetical protein
VAFDPPSATAGTSLSISDTVSNTGLEAASGFRVGLYLSSDATITSADRLLGFLHDHLARAGRELGGRRLADAARVDQRRDLLDRCLGRRCAGVSERLREQQRAGPPRSSIQIAAALLPDLELTAVTADRQRAGGRPARRLGHGHEPGRQRGRPVPGRDLLSNDATITAQDLLLGLRPVQSLAAGACSSAADALTVPPTISAGSWWLGALADPQGAVAESDETDNARSAPLPIQISVPPRPNLVLQSFACAPASVDSGTALDVSDRGPTSDRAPPARSTSACTSRRMPSSRATTRCSGRARWPRWPAARAYGLPAARSRIPHLAEIAGGCLLGSARSADAGLGTCPSPNETDNTLGGAGRR